MKCPICSHHNNSGLDLRSSGFSEVIVECTMCGTVWSINHGRTKIVVDTQQQSFLESETTAVEHDEFDCAL
ncbi:MAG: hypothetical protein C0620_02780 [Desulfuromonas sp.]|jgi:uncharacterized Zn finger protein|nr:MAG: hypothetical protein C0620_02780 [Desulfuromonas sp.]